MNFLKKRFKVISEDDIEKFKKEISDLRELLTAYHEKEKFEKYAHYIPIKSPQTKSDIDALNEYLAGLGKNEQFRFYIHNLENIILDEFRGGKEHSELYRGGLRIIQKIRDDIAESCKRKKDDGDETLQVLRV
jgi:hypothetical protein